MNAKNKLRLCQIFYKTHAFVKNVIKQSTEQQCFVTEKWWWSLGEKKRRAKPQNWNNFHSKSLHSLFSNLWKITFFCLRMFLKYHLQKPFELSHDNLAYASVEITEMQRKKVWVTTFVLSLRFGIYLFTI